MCKLVIFYFPKQTFPATLDAIDTNCRTPLHLATVSSQAKMVSWLLDHGANPTTKDKPHGRTPFHWAARLGHSKILSSLLTKVATYFAVK